MEVVAQNNESGNAEHPALEDWDKSADESYDDQQDAQ